MLKEKMISMLMDLVADIRTAPWVKNDLHFDIKKSGRNGYIEIKFDLPYEMVYLSRIPQDENPDSLYYNIGSTEETDGPLLMRVYIGIPANPTQNEYETMLRIIQVMRSAFLIYGKEEYEALERRAERLRKGESEYISSVTLTDEIEDEI